MARTAGSVGEATRQQILDAALQMFVEQGYDGTSIRDLSERLGMTKGSLYYHFSSKEKILHALVDPLTDAIDEFTAEAHGAGASTALMRRFVDLFDAHGAVVRCVLSDPSTVRPLMRRNRVPQRMEELANALAGSVDPPSFLRAQCALGVVHAAILAPDRSTHDAGPGPRSRFRTEPLTGAEKDFIATAAMAVLNVAGTGVRMPGMPGAQEGGHPRTCS